jgi:hypothetical protein
MTGRTLVEAVAVGFNGTQLDISAPKYPVEVKVRADGLVMWVNVGPVNVLRICQVHTIVVEDGRQAPLQGYCKPTLTGVSVDTSRMIEDLVMVCKAGGVPMVKLVKEIMHKYEHMEVQLNTPRASLS